ncbi:unnamed protein product [Amoebophrya sp. A120]|nr:unnamed protein product [Amoebophrya sp. A120]|eukprot:GSA120T00009637001.1
MFGACLSTSSASMQDDFLVGPCTAVCQRPVVNTRSSSKQPKRSSSSSQHHMALVPSFEKKYPPTGPTEDDLKQVLVRLYHDPALASVLFQQTGSPGKTSSANKSISSTNKNDPRSAYPPAKIPWEVFWKENLRFLIHYETKKPELRLKSSHLVQFLVLFRHSVKNDVFDLTKPIDERKYQDAFEGILTKDVNTQLIKDIARAEWTIDGEGFSFAKYLESAKNLSSVHTGMDQSTNSTTVGGSSTVSSYNVAMNSGNKVSSSNHNRPLINTSSTAVPPATDNKEPYAVYSKSSSSTMSEEPKNRAKAGVVGSTGKSQQVNSSLLSTGNIKAPAPAPIISSAMSQLQKEEKLKEKFQYFFLEKLENFFLAFAKQEKLSANHTSALIQAVTTQMCQCGLANLDRGSYSRKYLVSGTNLDQTTVYSLSKDGDSLKLTLMCMKTNFTDYFDMTVGGGVVASSSSAATGSGSGTGTGTAHLVPGAGEDVVVVPEQQQKRHTGATGTSTGAPGAASSASNKLKQPSVVSKTSLSTTSDTTRTADQAAKSNALNANIKNPSAPSGSAAAISPNEIVISPTTISEMNPTEPPESARSAGSLYLADAKNTSTANLSYNPLFCQPPASAIKIAPVSANKAPKVASPGSRDRVIAGDVLHDSAQHKAQLAEQQEASIMSDAPCRCASGSYLYQHATLKFTPNKAANGVGGGSTGNNAGIGSAGVNTGPAGDRGAARSIEYVSVDVIDGLDEVKIIPP